MSTHEIVLKKIKPQDFNLLKQVIHDFAQAQQFYLEVLNDRKKYCIGFSVAIEMWYDFNQKTAKQHIAENSKLKLSLHKAIILLDALLEFSKTSTATDYEKSRCNRFAMAIDEQIPTITQLIS